MDQWSLRVGFDRMCALSYLPEEFTLSYFLARINGGYSTTHQLANV